jgi:hypothetical protein
MVRFVFNQTSDDIFTSMFCGHLMLRDEASAWSQNVIQQTPSDRNTIAEE